jgi:hypothetical protein
MDVHLEVITLLRRDEQPLGAQSPMDVHPAGTEYDDSDQQRGSTVDHLPRLCHSGTVGRVERNGKETKDAKERVEKTTGLVRQSHELEGAITIGWIEAMEGLLGRECDADT